MRLKEEEILECVLLDVTKYISRYHWTVLKSAVIYKISHTCYDLSLRAQFHMMVGLPPIADRTALDEFFITLN